MPIIVYIEGQQAIFSKKMYSFTDDRFCLIPTEVNVRARCVGQKSESDQEMIQS